MEILIEMQRVNKIVIAMDKINRKIEKQQMEEIPIHLRDYLIRLLDIMNKL